MAKLEKKLDIGFDEALRRIEDGIMGGSITATLEEKSDLILGDARCSVRAFERYSAIGSNRVSLTVTLFEHGDSGVYLSAAATGGSQAVFWKINTFGEQAFLRKLTELFEE